jgi:putative sugar O-methyltransferase
MSETPNLQSIDIGDSTVVDGWIKANLKSNSSQFWLELNQRNIQQLRDCGYENFKRTIALNYFTWVVRMNDEQAAFLKSHLSSIKVAQCFVKSLFSKKLSLFRAKHSVRYKFLTYLLYEYVTKKYSPSFFMDLREPLEGNPPVVFQRNQPISQDLINSLLEYNSIVNSGMDMGGIKTILELGAGYGRNAFVFLKLKPGIKYIVVDIFPALYISSRYLSNQFPGKKTFQYREFESFAQVKQEFAQADMVFLMPHQLQYLPEKSIDLFINISSFHEMIKAQMEYYFSEVARLTKGYLYFKQWKESKIPGDNIIIKESDYPVKKEWTKLFWRECEVQTKFFEAMFKL